MYEEPEAPSAPVCSAAEYYKGLGRPFETRTYTHPDGRCFTIERPKGVPDAFPYPFRTVTFEELMTIWSHHRGLVESLAAA